MRTLRNEQAVLKLDELKSRGFKLSYNSIALYFEDSNIMQPNGIPYTRGDVFNRLASETKTDENIIKCIAILERRFNRDPKSIERYSRGVGAPMKKR